MWKRHRFRANLDDPRPVVYPPPGPYWVSGEGDDYAIVIAYLPLEASVQKYWPEATDIDSTDEREIIFTTRFPQPAWWSNGQDKK